MKTKAISTIGAFALSVFAIAPAFFQSNPLAPEASAGSDRNMVIIGSADFPESQLLGTIYAQALTAKGLAVETRFNIGSREVYMPALLDGSIDIIPEYAGATLYYFDTKSTAHSPDEVLTALKAKLPDDLSMLKPSEAQNGDIVAVTKATAEKYKLKTIEDLAPVAGELDLGASPEWKTRREGVVGLKEVYGITFKNFRVLDIGGPLTISALANGQVQAADLFSTDPAIAENGFVSLEDTKNLFAAQNVVPIVATQKLTDVVADTLDSISAVLTTDDLISMNGRLANHEGYDAVAADFLAQKKLK